MFYLQRKLGNKTSKLCKEALIWTGRKFSNAAGRRRRTRAALFWRTGAAARVLRAFAHVYCAADIQLSYRSTLIQHSRPVLVLYLPGGLGQVPALPAAGVPRHREGGGSALPVLFLDVTFWRCCCEGAECGAQTAPSHAGCSGIGFAAAFSAAAGLDGCDGKIWPAPGPGVGHCGGCCGPHLP